MKNITNVSVVDFSYYFYFFKVSLILSKSYNLNVILNICSFLLYIILINPKRKVYFYVWNLYNNLNTYYKFETR